MTPPDPPGKAPPTGSGSAGAGSMHRVFAEGVPGSWRSGCSSGSSDFRGRVGALAAHGSPLPGPNSILSYLSAPTPALTLGDLDVQGRADQSHEGRIEVDGVVIGHGQIHAKEPLQKTKGGGSHYQAPLPVPREPDPHYPGSPGRTLKAVAKALPTLR